MERDKIVDKGEKKYSVTNWSSAKTLKIPSLKPSDWFLVQQCREYFGYDLRQVLVLGVRWLYAGWHDPVMRKMILSLATQINSENLDTQGERVEYKKLKDL